MRSECKQIALPHFLESPSLRRATHMLETNFAPFLLYVNEPVFHLLFDNVPLPWQLRYQEQTYGRALSYQLGQVIVLLIFFSSGYQWMVLSSLISVAFSQIKVEDSSMEFIISESWLSEIHFWWLLYFYYLFNNPIFDCFHV